jgi:hypothetical protein
MPVPVQPKPKRKRPAEDDSQAMESPPPAERERGDKGSSSSSHGGLNGMFVHLARWMGIGSFPEGSQSSKSRLFHLGYTRKRKGRRKGCFRHRARRSSPSMRELLAS